MLIKKTILYFTILSLSVSFLSAQSNGEEEVKAEAEEEIIQRTEKLEPLLPQLDSSVIFIEGEDAVSTNFNREPLLNYTCSGFRTLQLNQSNALHGDATYNSDYVFYVEEDGVYELWYGGTPPGNRDELVPSYASPFQYVLDGIYTQPVYREDINVVEEYAPAYYWNYVNDITLSAGEHRLKIEILQRRSFDNKFFFYFDNFFLVKKVNGKRVLSGTIPEVFPKDLDNRSIDSNFKSFEDYEVLIRDNPENIDNYIFIAKIYSLTGDYLNALKYLRRASFLEPDDPEIMLLTAKNLIWKGSTQEGLALYKDLLQIVPERIDLWTEAGKVAGWTGQYLDSIDFFEGGLENLADDLSLLTNQGITNLWMGSLGEAEKIFGKVENLAGDDLKHNRELAEIFRVNGYPDKAIPILRRMINEYPDVLELYFDLEEAYIEDDQRDKIEDIRKITEDTFTPNSEYNKVTGTFYESQRMKEKVIEDYEEQLKNDPDNLNLRRVLAEIYFWNGFKKKAISEYRNILTNYTYLNLLQTELDMTSFLELLDRNYALSYFIKDVPSFVNRNQKELSDLLKTYKKAKADYETLKKKNEADTAKGTTVDLTATTAKKDEIFELEEKLAVLIYINESYIERFNSLSSQFADENMNLSLLLDDEEVSAKAFELLIEGVNWSWDRTEMINELKAVKSDGVVLGNYVLGKIYQYEGLLSEARSNYAPLVESDYILERALFSLYETEIWLGEDENRLELYNQFPSEIDQSSDYVYYLNEYLDYLYLEEEDIFSYLTGDPAESINTIISAYKELVAEAGDISKNIEANINKIHKVLKSNMEQGFYTLASETYLLRNELGDFYYNEKMYPQGIAQYKQVLEIDPWNLSAKFKLAQVYHFNGDWSKALDIYGEIYADDPGFNNVASFYNELTREFADSFNFSGKSFSDTSSLVFNAQADYSVNFSRNFGLSIDYEVEFNRNYRAFDGTDPTDATSLLLQNINVRLPLSLSFLTINPEVGIYLKTDLVDGDGREDVLPNDPELTSNLTLYGFLLEHNFYPKAGANLLFAFDSLSIQPGYLFDWVHDSFHPGKSPVFYHKASLELGMNFIKTEIPFIEDTAIFMSGYSKFLSDGNLNWFASAVLSNSIQLVRQPVMNLNISLDFSIEDALTASLNYWTPEMSILTGLNLEYAADFYFKNDISLSERLWFNTDFYSNGADNSQGLAFEVGNRFSYKKRDFTTYLNIAGSFTTRLAPTPSNIIDYWSLTIELGVNALLPDLLTP